jgi:hypothetical protein
VKLLIKASIKSVASFPDYLKKVEYPDGDYFELDPKHHLEFEQWVEAPINALQLKRGKYDVVLGDTGEVVWSWESFDGPDHNFQKVQDRRERKEKKPEMRREERKIRKQIRKDDKILEVHEKEVNKYVEQIASKAHDAQDEFGRGEGDFRDLQEGGNIEWDYDMQNAVINGALMEVPREYYKDVARRLRNMFDGLVLS